MKKLIAAALIAGAAFVAVPTAANAATSGYAPETAGTVSGNYVAGGTAVVNFNDNVFAAGETVNVQVTGAGAVTLGALPTTTVSKTYTADANGGLTIRVTFPAGGSGTYNLTATGATSGTVGTAFFSIAPAAGGTGTTVGSTGGTGTPGELAFTGGTISTLGLWAAGGALVLGGGLLVVRKSVRRQRDAA
ncbi:sortase [Curtobacterium caseinilyticum]|uniref:Sortase n=1 Tax=Curtobacterium caseinilyticum TaxID=3055137 RepID=A0ABT7TQS0_9MICO|nr:sortase [Curtobacterium caseinilyticum]MDM7891953.1 sortase [Curtobacterium caseinilyticum]